MLSTQACGDSTGTGTGGGGTGGATTAAATGGGGGGTGGSGPGGASGGDWSCLGTIPAPTFFAGADTTINVTVKDLVSDAPISGVNIDVCDKTDPTCATPSDTTTTNTLGGASLAVPTSSAHFLELSITGYPDHLVHANAPLENGFNLVVLTNDDQSLVSFVALSGGTADSTRGHVGTGALDCQGQPSAGVTFTVDTADGSTVYGYFATTGLPAAGLTETTVDGRVGIANLPVGPAVVTATVTATSEVIATRSFEVRAGSVTYPAVMSPTPEP